MAKSFVGCRVPGNTDCLWVRAELGGAPGLGRKAGPGRATTNQYNVERVRRRNHTLECKRAPLHRLAPIVDEIESDPAPTLPVTQQVVCFPINGITPGRLGGA